MKESPRSVPSSGRTFLTSAGVETFLLFQQGFPLCEFCEADIAFRLSRKPKATSSNASSA